MAFSSRRLKVEVLSIGDELLIGQTVNTNAAWMGRALEAEGWHVARCVVIPDDRVVMLEALREAEARSELVLLTGGLGPTRDDITKHVLCEHHGTELVRHPDIEERIVAWFERRGREVLQVNRDQALLPADCLVLDNPLGTASGMWFEREGGVTVSMPGVPYEMEHILTHGVVPEMRKRLVEQGRLPRREHRSILTMGTGESQLALRIDDLETEWMGQGIKLAYLPSPGSVRIRLTGEDESVALLDQAQMELIGRLAEWVVSEEGRTVEQELAGMMLANGWTLAVAESCTGGGLGAALVAKPGASGYFLGGIQAYANSVKVALLGVSEQELGRHGAVSEPVARAMAEGARTRLGSDFGVGITGIAGPDGGSEAKPVGTVFIACSGPQGTRCVEHHFGRERMRNLGMTVRAACALALEEGRALQVEGGSPAERVADSL